MSPAWKRFPPRPSELGHTFLCIARDARGRLLWRARLRNHLSNEGVLDVLGQIYRAVGAPYGANLYVGLYNTTPLPTDTLSTLTSFEMSGNGYARVAWARGTTDWGAPAILPTGEGETLGVAKNFTASGGSIGPFTYLVLATTSDNSGHTVAYAPFSSAMTITNGTSLAVTPRARLRGVTS